MANTKTRKAPPPQERMINDASKFLEALGLGDAVAQGDLYLVPIAALPKSAKPRANRQLADGATQGSRHVMTRGDVYDAAPKEVAKLIKAACPKAKVPEAFIGPVVVAPSDPTADDLSHPEHGNCGAPAGTTMAVVFQRAWDRERRLRRVAD